MAKSIIYDTNGWLVVGVLFLLMLSTYFLGRIIGHYRVEKVNEKKFGVSNTILAASFALLGLLLGFTFHLAGSRYDMRRQYVIDEANAIRTAILRADMYDEDDRELFRNDFKKYLEIRIAYFTTGADYELINAYLDSTKNVFIHLWSRAANLSKNSKYGDATKQMIPALNDMIDITVTRRFAGLARVPDSILGMLFMLAIINSFFTGYSEFGSERKDWFVVLGFCVITALVIYIILDLDRPRRGIITLKQSNKAIEDLRTLFKE